MMIEMPRFMGVRVIANTDEMGTAYARDLLLTRRIYVGMDYFRLNYQQREAVLWHEYGHLKQRHVLRRLWRKLTRQPHDQTEFEMESDQYVVVHGHGLDLLSILRSHQTFQFSEARARRIERLVEKDQSVRHTQGLAKV